MLSKGQKINNRYEIVKSIGEGGMANVYLANDTILNRKVAVKVLRGDLSSDEKFIRRFEREALSVSNLSHPNIVEVYDVGVEENNHYIVMEYIEGKTLKQLLKKRESLTLAEVIDIMTQLTDGIAHAHEAYIIHRDIKPQNIMIEDDGRIKITDFGIAMALNATQLTQTNSVMGSVHYLPPEQASGKSATIKSDIYSLGIMMYELLTGTVPFKGDNAVEIAIKHMKDKIPSIRKQDPSIPQSVENIILKACAKNPRNRYDSAKTMHEDLLNCMTEAHQNDKKISFEYPENDFDSDDTAEQTKTKKKIEKPKVEEPAKEDNQFVKEVKNKIESKPISNEEEEFFDEPKHRNTLIIILTSFLLILLIAGGLVFYFASREPKKVLVPNVVGKTEEEAIKLLTDAGLDYDVKYKSSDKVETGLIISSEPISGRSRKKGDIVTIYESTGGEFHYLENYIGKNYSEIKAKLELLKINVTIDKKDVEDKEKYKGKENIIIDQTPKFDEKAEKVQIKEGDNITLFIPNIVNEYPDMVDESWSLSDTLAFVKEYKLNITVTDKSGNTIPENKYSEYSNSTVIEQSRPVGDAIIEGITLKVKLNATYEEPKKEEPENNDNETNENETE